MGVRCSNSGESLPSLDRVLSKSERAFYQKNQKLATVKLTFLYELFKTHWMTREPLRTKQAAVFNEDEARAFLNVRIPQLKETDPSEFGALIEMMLNSIKEEIKRRKNEGIIALTRAEIFGNLQYGSRAVKKAGGTPLVLDSSAALKEGVFVEESFQNLKQIILSIFKNLEEEVNIFEKEHGDKIKEILDNKGNLVFVCTHPSWYGLLIPALLMEKIDKSVLEKSLISMITAIGPLMVEKEMQGMKVNPQDILVALGINVLKTVPHKKEYEKNEDVLSFGNTMRYKFSKEFFVKERDRMNTEGRRSLIIAAEGQTTPLGADGFYEIAPIDIPTEGLLKRCVKTKNTHFVVLGISEENRKRENDLEPTNVTLKATILSPEELQERKESGDFTKELRDDMADLVDGRVQELQVA